MKGSEDAGVMGDELKHLGRQQREKKGENIIENP